MKRSVEMARDRLREDITRAIKVAAVNYATGCTAVDAKARIDTLVGADWQIADAIFDELTRNWSVVERPRGKRAAS